VMFGRRIDVLSPKGANACWLSIQILGGPQAVQTMVHGTRRHPD
jgi:hypothetical protein